MTTKHSRQLFYEEARRQLAVLKKNPKLKRKHLIPMIAFLFEGMLLIAEDREPGDVKDAQKA